MCEVNAYLLGQKGETEIMKEVDLMDIQWNDIVFRDLLGREAHVKCASVVAIQDPGVATRQLLHERAPFRLWCRDPAGFPVQRVEVVYFESEDGPKTAGELRLSRATGGYDCHLLQSVCPHSG